VFADPIQREAFRSLASAAHLHEAIDASPPEVADLLRRLAVTGLEADADPEGTYLALVRVAVEGALVSLNGEAREADRRGDTDRQQRISAESAAVKEELEVMRDPSEHPEGSSAAIGAARRLVAWMVQREGDRG
jgi:hypothetical protein